MAKNDNLKDFLTDVADAIREKKGTTDLINPQDFSAEIASIQSGGGAVAASAKAVNFRDYDGVILHSYTKDEFLALSELPPLPTREGLICQEWNWDFADAVEYVSEYGLLEVGATYITDDGKTRLYITIAAEGRMDVPLYFSQTVANGVTIDWGDGSATETLSGTGKVNTTHHYNAIGDYVISLDVADGCTTYLGHSSSSLGAMGANTNGGKTFCNMLRRVELGKNTHPSSYAFSGFDSLLTISIPSGTFVTGERIFYQCYSLQALIFPRGNTSIGKNCCYDCKALRSVSLSASIDTISGYSFYGCSALLRVSMPPKIKNMAAMVFYRCYSLREYNIPMGITDSGDSFAPYCSSLQFVYIPQSLEKIGGSAFRSAFALTNIDLPNGITQIDGAAFQGCYGLRFVDFSHFNTIPNLSSTNCFSETSSDFKIIVPDALYDEWIAATNWSTYANYIIKKSEWDALNA